MSRIIPNKSQHNNKPKIEQFLMRYLITRTLIDMLIQGSQDFFDSFI